MNQLNKELAELMGWLNKFLRRIKCLFKHDWLYCSEAPVNGEWHRQCLRCRKKMQGSYDMTYGGTFWSKGWDE